MFSTLQVFHEQKVLAICKATIKTNTTVSRDRICGTGVGESSQYHGMDKKINKNLEQFESIYLSKYILLTLYVTKNILAISHCRHFGQIFQQLEYHTTLNKISLTEIQNNIW
jgi:hypothetical protein